jgi:hypothetical protein
MTIKFLEKSKAAQSHVEMVLSFTIFVGFVMVILLFINPIREKSIGYASLEVVMEKVLSNLSLSYQYIGLILHDPVNSGCFTVNNTLGSNSKTLVLDDSGLLKNSKNNRQTIDIEATPNARFYKVYFSEGFNYTSPSSLVGCKVLPRSNYSFGVLVIENSVFLDNLQDFNKSYHQDYATLKTRLESKEDFDFTVYNIDKTQILFDVSKSNKLKTGNVLAREVPLRIINKLGERSDVVFILRVW